MADDSSQQREPNLRRAVEDVKALATLLGRRLKSRSPAVLFAIGVVVTIVLALVVVLTLALTGGAKALSDNAALLGALVALGGVFTAQMVSISLDERRAHEARDIEAQRAHETALQNYIEAVGELLIEKPLRRASPADNLSTVVRAQTLSVLEGLDPDRKRILLLFLYESGLIYRDKPVVSLAAANLSDATLSRDLLHEAYLRAANLSDANLSNAIGLTDEQIAAPRTAPRTLEGATMPNGQEHEDWLKSKDQEEDG
jgi:Pentapeptide repeats (8 copies)